MRNQAIKHKVTYLHFFLGNAASFAKASNQRRSECATAQATLLATTSNERVQSDPGSTTHVAGADALGAVNFMRRNGHQVNVHGVDIQRNLSDGLRGVSVEENLLLTAQLANLVNGLDNTNFIVDSHDTDKGSFGANGRLQVFHLDQAVVLHGEIGDIETLVLQMSAAIKHALVLCLGCDDVPLLA